MGWLTLLAPILLELLKIFFGSNSKEADKQKIAEKIRDDLSKINAAIAKSVDSEGDTSDIEDIINHRH